MSARARRAIEWIVVLAVWGGLTASVSAQPAPAAEKARVVAALDNITSLIRPGEQGYATVWDGNKYVQCGRREDHSLRCEAAGSLMQPSLAGVLTPERVSRLAALGWRLDTSFGNYVESFPSDMPTSEIADKLLQVLTQGYNADLAHLDVETAWVRSEPCPPRNGPSQNLAGMINDAPAMAATAVYACAYHPPPDTGPSLPAATAAELITQYGARVTGEIQRLRVNIDRRVFVAFDAGIGYVQCRPQAMPAAIYCEAQSAESWAALAAVLTPERIARLHAAGFAEPGHAPNYWKLYPLDQNDDARIAREVLTVLHDVYGYTGRPKLRIKTEEDRR